MKSVHLVSLTGYLRGLLAVLQDTRSGRLENSSYLSVIQVHAFSFWSFLMWLDGMVYVWLVQMLWRMDKQACCFLAVNTVFNLILDFTLMLGRDLSDVNVSFLSIHHPDLCHAPRCKRSFE